jgi:hypothetical protein
MDEHYAQVGIIAGPKTRIQWLISAFTQSPAFHVVIGIGNGQVISAQPGGVQIEPDSTYADAIWSEFEYAPGQADAIVAWAKLREHRPYNWVDDGMIGIEDMTSIRFPEWVTKHWDNDKSYQCAQFADAALWHGGNFHVFRDCREPGRVSPASWVPVFQQFGWWPENFWATNPSAMGGK